MNLRSSFIIAALTHIFYIVSVAQTDPGIANLTHQWTFDDGTATDPVGNANGTLMGAAAIKNKALNTSNGGYLSLPGALIAINANSRLSTEIWFSSSAGANTANTMLSYFGDADVNGWMGNNYLFTSPVNTGYSRFAISTGNTTNNPWSTENFINTSTIDDGLLHQFVAIVDSNTMSLYIDGILISTTTLTGTNSLSAVSNASAFLCKGGYTGDATWKGSVHKFSIYNKALSADEVDYLFQQGAESSVSINVSVTSLSFDEIYTTSTITVTGLKLSNDITIVAPVGISVEPATVSADAINAPVNITYDGSTDIDSIILFTSDSIQLALPVKANSNASCFSSLYPDITNLIAEPYMNSINNSWGKTSLISGSEVFCGSRCVRISGSETCWPNGGSVGSNSITWIPNATYRFHAKVKTMDGTFAMGVQNANVNGTSGDYNMVVPNTNGQWADFDATFTTGSSPTSGIAFFNNCGSSTGLTGYIDNWELYAIPGISTSVNTIYLDEFSTNTSFTVTGVNLTDPIVIEASEGITVDQTNLNSNASNVTINVTSSVSGTFTGNISLSSGSVSKEIQVLIYNNSECFTPLYSDLQNLISDPYVSDISNFSGWGTRAVNSNPLYSYCGATSGMISEKGSLEKDLTGAMKPNTAYHVKAFVYRRKPGNITYTLDLDSLTYPTEYVLLKAAMDSACSIYNAYFPIDVNIYVYYNSGIPTAQASYYGSIGFGASRTYMWVGTAMHEIDHYLGSGTAGDWKALVVGGKWTGDNGNAVCQEISNSNVSSDGTHFWPHGINYRSEIENLGGISEQLAGLHANARIAKAMIVDDAGLGANKEPVGVGIIGWNADSNDIYYQITDFEKWQEVNFTFTTGETLGTTQAIYFNAGPGFIDNWEMYEIPADTLISVKNKNIIEPKVYTRDNDIITEIELPRKTDITIILYDLQGKLISVDNFNGEAGFNKLKTKAPTNSGIYLIKVISNEFVLSKKVMIHK